MPEESIKCIAEGRAGDKMYSIRIHSSIQTISFYFFFVCRTNTPKKHIPRSGVFIQHTKTKEKKLTKCMF